VTYEGVAERVGELAGPIVVKEVRQGLRAKVFGIFFGLLLLGCLVVASVAAAQSGALYAPTGADYLGVFLAAQPVVCLFVIPFVAFRSMIREREEETWVLLALTGLPARAIVRGKVSSALAQASLFASCCAPFVLFSYYLNGIDLLTLLLGLWLTFCATVFVVCGAVALGTEGQTRMVRNALQLVAVVVLGLFTFLAIVFGFALAREGGRMIHEDGFAIAMAVLSFALLSTSVVLLEAGGSNLALPTEAQSGGVRVAIALQHSLPVLVSLAFSVGSKTVTPEVPAAASIFTSLMLVVTGFFLVSEEEGYPGKLKKTRWTAPGAFRGWRLLMMLLAFDTAGWLVFSAVIDRTSDHWTQPLLAAPAYVGLYLCLAVLAARIPFFARSGHKSATRAAFFSVVGLAAVLMPVASVLCGERANDLTFNTLNPIFGMVNYVDRPWMNHGAGQLTVLWTCFVFAGLFAWGQLSSRDVSRGRMARERGR